MDALTDEFASAISIHALRVEGDLSHSMFPITAETISIHALRVEGDMRNARFHKAHGFYFYPRPPGGGRLLCSPGQSPVDTFLSTPSGWRATRGNAPAGQAGSPISIHALRVEGDLTAVMQDARKTSISIHALRVEGDSAKAYSIVTASSISIHALRVEGDPSTIREYRRSARFLSTPSGWRATHP